MIKTTTLLIALLFIAVFSLPTFAAGSQFDDYVRQGNDYFDQRQDDKGIESYQEALAIKPDSPMVLIDLATLYRRTGQPQKALSTLDKALSLQPDLETALFNRGVVYYVDLNNPEKAKVSWEKLVSISQNQKLIGVVQNSLDDIKNEKINTWYQEGIELKKNKQFAESIQAFKKAANEGHARAQQSVGMGYIMGRGVEKDARLAAHWWRLAAEQGDKSAQNNIGILYRTGQGVPQDYEQARIWCSKSAYQGLSYGQYSLGLLYKKGLGVPQNDVEAYAWWMLAADAGNKMARKALDAVQEELDQDEKKMGLIYARVMVIKSEID